MDSHSKTFFSLWRNKYILNEITNHSRKLKKNEKKKFKDLKSLKEYNEIEYVYKLVYKGRELINKGDLPMNGVLNEIEFTNTNLSSIKGDAIPYGVTKLSFANRGYSTTITSPLSTLPSTIEHVFNIVINEDESSFVIPPNIKTLRFCVCLGEIKENTFHTNITDLSLGYNFNNNKKPLKEGDLPNSLERLYLYYYNGILNENVIPKSVTDLSIAINGVSELKQNIIPNGIKRLLISFNDKEPITITPQSIPNSVEKLEIMLNRKSELKAGSIPNNVKQLFFSGCHFPITNETFTDENHKNIKSMSLCYRNQDSIVTKGSLPNSLTCLKIIEFKSKLIENTIPDSVTSLAFESYSSFDQDISQTGILPPFLQHLEINEMYPINKFQEMIQYLPTSLNSICLPGDYQDTELSLPSHIKVIKYNEVWDV